MRGRRGMTLVEVLLALALLLGLGGVTLRFVSQVSSAREASAEREAELWGAALVFEHLERDLLSAFAIDGDAIVGDAVSCAISSVRFVDGEPRARRLTVEFDASAGTIVARVDGGASEVVAERVAWCSWRYLSVEGSGEAWADETRGVPRAVEVRVWFGDEAESSEPSRAADRRRLIPVFDAPADDPADVGDSAGIGGVS